MFFSELLEASCVQQLKLLELHTGEEIAPNWKFLMETPYQKQIVIQNRAF